MDCAGEVEHLRELTDQRFAAMDQTRDLLTRREYEANHTALMQRLEVVETTIARGAGEAAGVAGRQVQGQWSVTTALAAAGVVISLVLAVVVLLRG